MLIAVSIDAAFKSGIFNSAIFLTCSFVKLPTLVLFGTPEPLSNPGYRPDLIRELAKKLAKKTAPVAA